MRLRGDTNLGVFLQDPYSAIVYANDMRRLDRKGSDAWLNKHWRPTALIYHDGHRIAIYEYKRGMYWAACGCPDKIGCPRLNEVRGYFTKGVLTTRVQGDTVFYTR